MRESESNLPIRITEEQVVETPQTKMAIDKQFVEKFKPTAEPSVLNLERFKGSGTVLNVTYFNKGQNGQRIVILGDGTTTIVHDPLRIKTNTGANKLLAVDKVYRFTRYDDVWVEDDGGSGGGGGLTGLPTISTTAGTTKIVNTTTYADVDNTMDLVLPVAAGDKLLVSVSCLWSNVATWGDLDVATIVSAAVVNYISGFGATGPGVMAWRGQNTANNWPFGGTITYTVVAGDIDGGNIRLRLRAKAGVSRTLFTGTLHFSVVNLKQ
jgi:hypothetical protein